MATKPLLPDPDCLALDALRIENGVILFAVRTTRCRVACPHCGNSSERAHSRYRRTLTDLPWQGNAVRIEMTARKFFCDNKACSRRIFTEPMPVVVARYARKTARLAEALQELTLLVGGEAAARIAKAFGLILSPDALLEAVHKSPTTVARVPRVLGIDDFAFRRGHFYGTILVDLERRCPVDLLPDREAATVAKWLREHPGVEIISRDRGVCYKEGATRGAPDAVQVADRFHLLKNLHEALERQVASCRHRLQEIAGQKRQAEESAKDSTGSRTGMSPTPGQKARQIRRAEQRTQRQRDYDRVHELRRQGYALGAIAEETGVSPRTIQRFLRAESFPERSPRSPQRRRTDAFAAYLRQRIAQGCRNAAQLFREVKERGYQGSYANVYAEVREIRETESPQGASGKVGLPSGTRSRTLSSRNIAWWLRGHYSPQPELTAYQAELAQSIREQVPVLQEAADLAKQFIAIVKARDAPELESWLEAACRSGSKEMRLFAGGLQHDESAVRNAVTLDWSNGQVEGQVNRVKFLKRSMYGSAGFDLLKARVLHRATA